MNRAQLFFDGVTSLVNDGKWVVVKILNFCRVSDTPSYDITTSELEIRSSFNHPWKPENENFLVTAHSLICSCFQYVPNVLLLSGDFDRRKHLMSTLIRVILCRDMDEDGFKQIYRSNFIPSPFSTEILTLAVSAVPPAGWNLCLVP